MKFVDLKPGEIYAWSHGRRSIARPMVVIDATHRWRGDHAPHVVEERRNDGGALVLAGQRTEDASVLHPAELLARAGQISNLVLAMDRLGDGKVCDRLGELGADVTVAYPRDVTGTWEQMLEVRRAATDKAERDRQERAVRQAERERARAHVGELVGDHPALALATHGRTSWNMSSATPARAELLWPDLEAIIMVACDRAVAAATGQS